jgi:hypothetical protein
LKTALLILDEKPEAAIAECGKILRFGRSIQKAQGGWIHALVGTAFIGNGLEGIRELLERSDLETGVLRNLGDELHAYELNAEVIAEVIRGEYFWVSSLVDSLLEQPDPEVSWVDRLILRFTFKPQKTKQLLASAYRSLIECYQSPRTQVQSPPEPEFDVFNLRGAEVYSLLAPNTGTGIDYLTHAQEFTLRAYRLLFALRRHEIENGSLPESLDELVPSYIDAIPADPYDDKPLRYSREKRIIYSVGRDEQDDGGSVLASVTDALRDYDEPTLRLPARASAAAPSASVEEETASTPTEP